MQHKNNPEEEHLGEEQGGMERPEEETPERGRRAGASGEMTEQILDEDIAGEDIGEQSEELTKQEELGRERREAIHRAVAPDLGGAEEEVPPIEGQQQREKGG